jgi:chemotaxis protein MotA
MNKSAWSGLLIAWAVLYFGVFKGTQNPALFLDSHALILVLGGTLAATLIAFPFNRLLQIRDMILLGVLFKRQAPHLKIAEEILDASVTIKAAGPEAVRALPKPAHPFMSEAYYFLSRKHLDAFELKNLLMKRSDFFKKRYLQDYKTLNALGKFPPAFGLLGATTGMITMMTQLSGSTDQIGPAMATALVATFWGIAVANLLILPLADYAHRVVQEDQTLRMLIIEGVLAIRENQPPIIIFERMASQLTPDHRGQLKESFRRSQSIQGLEEDEQVAAAQDRTVISKVS